jgi:hypothetical protein
MRLLPLLRVLTMLILLLLQVSALACLLRPRV